MTLKADPAYDQRLKFRHRLSAAFATVCKICTWSALLILLFLLVSVAARVSREGEISVFVDSSEPSEARLKEVETLLLSHRYIERVDRDSTRVATSVSF